MKMLPLGLIVISLGGCSTPQLVDTTIAVSGGVDKIYREQAIANLGAVIDDEWAIPSQADITTGVVQTSNVIMPNLTFPISHQLQDVVSATPSATRTRPSSGAGVTASQAWQQSWTTAALTDPNQLKQLRALYRFAVYGKRDPEYDYYINAVFPQRPGGWVLWGSSGSAMRPANVNESERDLVKIGSYKGRPLYMTIKAYQSGLLSDFVLATMAELTPGPNRVQRKAVSRPVGRTDSRSTSTPSAPPPARIQGRNKGLVPLAPNILPQIQ